MDFWHIIGDITILLAVAVFLGIIAERIGLSGVVGYLLAGTIVGPSVFGWVASDEESIKLIAEIGVALLLFTIGLEVNNKRLKQLLGRGLIIGSLQILITGLFTFSIAKLFVQDLKTAIIIGSMVALSSTAVVTRVLQDRSELDAPHGRFAFSILLVQDLAIVPLMILVAFLSEAPEAREVAAEIGSAGAKLIALVVIIFLSGVLVLPHFFGAALIRRSSEFPVILGISTCLSSMWLSNSLGLSPALGAFIAGLILAGTPFAAQVRGDMAPLRYIFLTLFFAATGMMASFPWLFTGYHWLWTAGVVVCIVVGKSAIIWIVGLMMKEASRVSIAGGLCLAQIGEFSFVIGAEAFDADLVSNDIFQLMMVSSLITLLLSPFLIFKSRAIAFVLDSLLGSAFSVFEESTERSISNHVIVIGYGVAGRNVVKDLHELGHNVLVIDMSPTGIKEAQQEGATGVLGNSQRRDVLEHAGSKTSKLIVTTLPDYRSSVQTIQQIRAISSNVPIVSRSRYSIHGDLLRTAGADIVVDEEECVGHILAQKTMQQLGL